MGSDVDAGLVVLAIIIAFVVIFEGLIAGDIWESKGGSILVGFFAGAILGPLGVLWTAFSRPGKRSCFECEQRVPDGAIKCWACGSERLGEEEDLEADDE